MFTVFQMDGVIFYPLQIDNGVTYVHFVASNGQNDPLFHSYYFPTTNMSASKQTLQNSFSQPTPYKSTKG